jgi:hypothetical protein
LVSPGAAEGTSGETSLASSKLALRGIWDIAASCRLASQMGFAQPLIMG